MPRKKTPKTVVELKVEPDAVAVEPDIKYKKFECSCGTSVLSKSMKKHLTSKKHLKAFE